MEVKIAHTDPSCRICNKVVPYIPKELDDFNKLLNEESLYAMAKGMFMIREPSSSPYNHSNTNFTLFPVKIPLSLLKRMDWFNVKLSHLLMNVLVKQPDWIIKISEEIAKEDPFVERMLRIAKSYLQNPRQAFTCTILRNDFMIDNQGTPSAQLIEYNTISCGLSILGRKVSEIHKHASLCFPQLFPSDNPGLVSSIGEISPGDALYTAFQQYGNSEANILLIGQKNEKNEGDRYGVRLDLFEKHHIFAHVVTLADVGDNAKLDTETGALFYNNKEVGLVYYRAGYSIDEYGEKEWKAREMIEFSKAVKCPNILLHLLTLKRFQTEFGEKEVLSRFLDPKDPQFEDFRSLFTNFVQLRHLTPKSIEMVKEAQQYPQHFVLKTSKEAGEGNVFEPEDISKVLSAYPDHPEQLHSQLLMRRIALPSRIIPVCINGEISMQSTNDEISQFMYVGANINTKEITPQKTITRLVRTKKSSENEGSFFKGSCLSSIWSYDDTDPSKLDNRFYSGLWEDKIGT